MQLASTGGDVETGISGPDPTLLLEDKMLEDDKDAGDIA
jgi:hypothetical protein